MSERIPSLLFRHWCVLAMLAGVLASRAPWIGTLGCAVLLLALGRPRHAWRRRTTLLACAALAWAYAALMTPLPPEHEPNWFVAGKTLRVRGDVTHVSGQPDRRLRLLLANVRPAGEQDAGELPGLPGLVVWSWDQGQSPDGPRPLPGQTVEADVRLYRVTGFRNEGVSDSEDYWTQRGVWYRAWSQGAKARAVTRGAAPWWAAWRENLRAGMVEDLGGSTALVRGRPAANSGMSQAKAVLPALIFGDRYALDSATLDLFTRAGLVHSLALSGQHLVLAGMAAAVLVWLIIRGKPGLLLRWPRRTLLLIAGLPLAAIYLWIGDAPPSLTRAALMMAAGALFWLGGRPVTLPDTLFFAVFCLLAAWPAALFDVGLQLSVLSVAGIALALPWLRELNRTLRPRPRSSPARSLALHVIRAGALLLATSLAVQIATAPLVLSVFGRLTPLFPLNLIWLPVLEGFVLPAAAASLALSGLLPGAARAIQALAALPGEALLALLGAMDARHLLPVWQGLKPSPVAMLGYAAAVAAFAALRGRKRPPKAALRLAWCAALLLALGPLARETDALVAAWQQRVTLRVLDVGQGQALVLEWPDGRLLLDGGGSISTRFDPGRDIVAHALTNNRPPRLALVMASHGDADHARGLRAILETFRVGLFARSALPLRGEDETLDAIRRRRGIPLLGLQRGETLDLGSGFALETLHPPAEGNFSSNNGSLIVRFVHNGHGLAVMCGDAETPALRRALEFALSSGRSLRADVLVMPHHGSSGALLPAFYDAVNPRLAVVSRGEGNSFGMPSRAVLDALGERGIPLLDTARDGEIILTWRANPAPTLRWRTVTE